MLRARGRGSIDAVREYEARYGVAPKAPMTDWSFPHDPVTEAQFSVRWTAARADLESGPPHVDLG